MKRIHALLILVALFVAMSAISWQLWINPTIDTGREMNTPLRMLRGETLYRDVYYIYGPVAPCLNALLFKLFGIHLNVLYIAGLLGCLLLVLLVYHLGRNLMTEFEAMLAGSTVILFCIFKQSGNLVFPYSFSTLYGTLLGTLSLFVQVKHARSRSVSSLIAAGMLAGLSFCCKAEFGFAATASLLVLAITSPRGRRLRDILIAAGSILPFPILIYGLIFAEVSAKTWLKDTYNLPGYIPAELVHFYRTKMGLTDPGKTLRELISALALLGGISGILLFISAGKTEEPGAGRRRRRILSFSLGCLALLMLHVLLFGTDWDLNPFRALPALFLGIIFLCLKRSGSNAEMNARDRTLLVVSIYGLAVLTRIILRIPAGGGYGSGLLPIPLLLFVFLATSWLPSLAISPAAVRRAHRSVSLLLMIGLVASLGVLSFRYLKYNYVRLYTSRGTIRLRKPVGTGMYQAIHFLEQNSRPGEYILTLPEGSCLNFLADRPAPLRHEILTPGYLTADGEHQAIRKLQEKNVRFVFVFNRSTTEFGPKAIGRDYYRVLMGWIDANYSLASVFGEEVSAQTEIGDPRFFIRCYIRRDDRRVAR